MEGGAPATLWGWARGSSPLHGVTHRRGGGMFAGRGVYPEGSWALPLQKNDFADGTARRPCLGERLEINAEEGKGGAAQFGDDPLQGTRPVFDSLLEQGLFFAQFAVEKTEAQHRLNAQSHFDNIKWLRQKI